MWSFGRFVSSIASQILSQQLNSFEEADELLDYDQATLFENRVFAPKYWHFSLTQDITFSQKIYWSFIVHHANGPMCFQYFNTNFWWLQLGFLSQIVEAICILWPFHSRSKKIIIKTNNSQPPTSFSYYSTFYFLYFLW